MVSLAEALARAQFAHAAADAPPQQGTQGGAIGVAHLRGNLVDTRATGLQQMHRAFDALNDLIFYTALTQFNFRKGKHHGSCRIVGTLGSQAGQGSRC